MPTLPPTFEPARDDDLLAALTSGAPLPAGAPSEARLVADLFAALAAPSAADELDGLDAARQAFRTQGAAPAPGRSHRPALRGRRAAAVPTSRPRAGGRLVAASLAGVLGLGGFTAAAFAGVLPDSIQTVAHRLVGAPSPERSSDHRSNAAAPSGRSGAAATTTAAAGAKAPTRTGPDATGPAAFGLCTAYARSRVGGNRAAYEHSTAYQGLVLAAGGADKVATYCAAVPHPSSSGSHGGGAGSGKPSDPGSSGGGRPTTGRPSETGRPSDAPSHPTHTKATPDPTTGGPTSTPPVVKTHPSHTKTATKAAPVPHTKSAGSTHTAH